MVKSLRDNILPPKEITLANGKVVKKPRSIALFVVILVLIAMYYSVQLTGFNLSTLM